MALVHPADASVSTARSRQLLQRAVHRHRALSVDGLLERAFTACFTSLVYPQIWEDPVTDMEALAIGRDSRIVTIASGGCNAMSYLTADPAEIIAVDLNAAHIALLQLKLAAAAHLPHQSAFFKMFAVARDRSNVTLYDQVLRQHLDEPTRRYWDSRTLSGRRRIDFFARNIYRFGLLGRCISSGHVLARMLGADPRRLMDARTREEQIAIFEREIAPLFDRRVVRWLLDHRISLFGLGIPPAQYADLGSGTPSGMADTVRQRLRRLACDHDFSDNYFAWQAFNRAYPQTGENPLPPYLRPSNFDMIRARVSRVRPLQMSFTECLGAMDGATVDRYVLLDAQDWMDDATLNALWQQITRTARPGARVLFRTAARPSLLPGRVAADILEQWNYEETASNHFTARDRSAIYGGVHLYVRRST